MNPALQKTAQWLISEEVPTQLVMVTMLQESQLLEPSVTAQPETMEAEVSYDPSIEHDS